MKACPRRSKIRQRRLTLIEKRRTHQLQLKTADQLGIVVKDMEQVIASWSALFGMGPWTFREMVGTDDQGHPLKVKLAFTYLGPLQIELVQPVEGRVLYSDFLDSRGEGLHHLGFFVDDLEGEVANLLAQGARILREKPGSYTYLDTGGPGGVIFELINKERISRTIVKEFFELLGHQESGS